MPSTPAGSSKHKHETAVPNFSTPQRFRIEDVDLMFLPFSIAKSFLAWKALRADLVTRIQERLRQKRTVSEHRDFLDWLDKMGMPFYVSGKHYSLPLSGVLHPPHEILIQATKNCKLDHSDPTFFAAIKDHIEKIVHAREQFDRIGQGNINEARVLKKAKQPLLRSFNQAVAEIESLRLQKKRPSPKLESELDDSKTTLEQASAAVAIMKAVRSYRGRNPDDLRSALKTQPNMRNTAVEETDWLRKEMQEFKAQEDYEVRKKTGLRRNLLPSDRQKELEDLIGDDFSDVKQSDIDLVLKHFDGNLVASASTAPGPSASK